jgi:predicted lipoprotein with Yx(FWY)xxD motif
MRFPRWAIPVAAALTATGLVLSACGQESAGGRQNTAAGAKAPAAPAADAPVPAAAPTALEVASVSKLGKIVTDGNGRTLYRFDNDTARPPASTCSGAYGRAWPPSVAGAGETAVQGVEKYLVG